MKVLVQCPKGHRFKCEQAHLGRTVKCPHDGCGVKFVLREIQSSSPPKPVPKPRPPNPSESKPIAVEPAVNAAGELIECPMCNKPMADDAVLCINCGFHKVSGTRVAQAKPE